MGIAARILNPSGHSYSPGSNVLIVKVRGNGLGWIDSDQNCYVYLDVPNYTLSAVSKEGSRKPSDVYSIAQLSKHSHVLRWSIPVITAEDANALLEEIRPFAERVCDGYESKDGVAVFDDEAEDASYEIEALCRGTLSSDGLVAWQAIDWLGAIGTTSRQRSHLKITSKTTNEQLKEIETRLVKDAKENYGVDKVNTPKS